MNVDQSRAEATPTVSVFSTAESVWRGRLWSETVLEVETSDASFRRGRLDLWAETTSSSSSRRGRVRALRGKPSTGDDGRPTFAFAADATTDASGGAAVEFPERGPLRVRALVHQDVLRADAAFLSWAAVVTPTTTTTTTTNGDAIDEAAAPRRGRSRPVSVTEHALVVEERFADNPYVCRPDPDNAPTTFFWYGKCGGENAGLDVRVSLRDAAGRPAPFGRDDVRLRARLVYADDGSPAPEMPVAPLKERRSEGPSKNPLLRPLRGTTTLSPSSATDAGVDFSFRVEEVSYHHKGHTGFALRVDVEREDGDDAVRVHPGVLEETIVVKSKPKLESDATHGRRVVQGGRSAVRRESFLARLHRNQARLTAGGNGGVAGPSPLVRPPPPCPASVAVVDRCSLSNLVAAASSRRGERRCLWCRAPLSADGRDALRPDRHARDCYFVAHLSTTLETNVPSRPPVDRLRDGIVERRPPDVRIVTPNDRRAPHPAAAAVLRADDDDDDDASLFPWPALSSLDVPENVDSGDFDDDVSDLDDDVVPNNYDERRRRDDDNEDDDDVGIGVIYDVDEEVDDGPRLVQVFED